MLSGYDNAPIMTGIGFIRLSFTNIYPSFFKKGTHLKPSSNSNASIISAPPLSITGALTGRLLILTWVTTLPPL